MYNQNSDLMKQEKFMLPTMIESDFSAEELAEDADGLQMSFPRVKIPAGGTLQFEMPSDDPDNPDYEKTLVGVIVLAAGRPVGAGGVAMQNDAYQSLFIVRIVR